MFLCYNSFTFLYSLLSVSYTVFHSTYLCFKIIYMTLVITIAFYVILYRISVEQMCSSSLYLHCNFSLNRSHKTTNITNVFASHTCEYQVCSHMSLNVSKYSVYQIKPIGAFQPFSCSLSRTICSDHFPFFPVIQAISPLTGNVPTCPRVYIYSTVYLKRTYTLLFIVIFFITNS